MWGAGAGTVCAGSPGRLAVSPSIAAKLRACRGSDTSLRAAVRAFARVRAGTGLGLVPTPVRIAAVPGGLALALQPHAQGQQLRFSLA